MFEVTEVASDLVLLSIEDLRSAAGVSDHSRDDALRKLEKQVSAALTSACRVATDGATPPTLRKETLSDTYRSAAGRNVSHHHIWSTSQLLLSRKPVVSVASVTENDVVLDPAADYEVRKSAGMLIRLSGDRESHWRPGKIVVAYDAGWEIVPENLKFAASRFVGLVTQQNGRDPLLKRQSMPGVLDQEWWVEPSREVAVPPEVLDMLERGGFINEWVG